MSHKVEYVIRKIKETLKMSQRVEETIRRAIEEAEKSLSETNKKTDYKINYIIYEVAKRPGLAKLLKILSERPMYTRELLRRLKMWERGQELISLAEHLGLVYRKWGKCNDDSWRKCLWNYITRKGKEVLNILEANPHQHS